MRSRVLVPGRAEGVAYGRPTKAVDRRRRLILSAIDVNAREIYCFAAA